jgi:pimeloyl-ACP methyl ester carboxylesterase
MKARAGDVGALGVSEIIAAMKSSAPDTRIHLVGHSFGGRVVTAVSKSLGDANKPCPSTMSLLQAAFSHNGFAQNYYAQKDGHFRSVMQNNVVDGPVLVTYTHNDRANALAYPLASRLAGQDAAAIGDPNDRFGAIGANGAQHTPEANNGKLLAVGENGYEFQSGTLYNLNADSFITDHCDVRGEKVAYAILAAITST